MPHTQMAMELMAPWSSPISMALVVPRAWLHAPVASPCATGSVTRNHLANRGANTAPTTPASTTAAAAMPAAPPRLSGDAHRDGGGHALGQQRGSEHVLHLKQAAQGQHTAQAGRTAHQATHQYRNKVFLQSLALVVDIQGQHRCHRPQHHLDDVAPLVIILQRDSKHRQQSDDHQRSNQQRVTQHPLCLFLQPYTPAPCRCRKSQSEKRGTQHGIHYFLSPFLRRSISSCTVHPVTR